MDDSKPKSDFKNDQWRKTCDQLKNAFDSWVELSEKDPGVSADDQRWEEMKSLLRDLKGKLEELSASSPRDRAATASEKSPSSDPTPKE